VEGETNLPEEGGEKDSFIGAAQLKKEWLRWKKKDWP